MKTISFQDLLAEQVEIFSEREVSTKISRHKTWGVMKHQSIELSHININAYSAEFNEPLNIRFGDPNLSTNVNICHSLQGKTIATSKQHAFEMSLESRNYHHVFVEDDGFDLSTDSCFTNVHVQIELAYFGDLLGTSDPGLMKMRDQLAKRQSVQTQNAYITQDMTQIIRDIFNNPLSGHFRKLFIEAKILELISLQLDQLTVKNAQTVNLRSRDMDVFYAIREYLQANFSKDFTLQQLAKDFGINECKLKKGFKETFQTTVFDYVFEKRMEEAYMLITESSLFVHEVSSKVGYKSANHFAIAFKKHFGKSPSELQFKISDSN